MSKKKINGQAVYEAEPVSRQAKTKREANTSPVPDINIRELVEERNWTALGGLALIALGVLYLFEGLLGLDISLWSVGLLGIGGWLMLDAWSNYQDNNRTWVQRDRNRLVGGAVIVLIGLAGILDLNLWEWVLLGIGGWLMIDAYQRYERNGHEWTTKARNRMIGGIVVAALGAISLFSLSNAWSLVLIVLGGAMLFGYIGGNR
ncbi:MAG: hypothetical protein JXJ20_00775 [Anaerolineae bacterium]|nr:hypothetical protein [Anaerolineae bacterium]